MLNINPGYNRKLMEQCKTLKEYMLYVEKVRNYTKKMELHQAVELAVNESIAEGILEKFLTRCKAEVIQVSIFEYDEEKEIEKIRRDEYEDGITQGESKKIVSIIRRNMNRGIGVSVIAEVLGLENVYVKQVTALIVENPVDTDIQIAEKLAMQIYC